MPAHIRAGLTWMFATAIGVTGCSNNNTNANADLVGSGVAGRHLPKVELKQCKPATEVGPIVQNARLPKYPAAEFFNNKPGEVVIKFDVTESGTTENIEVIRSTTEGFKIQAGAAVQTWQFKPAIDGNARVRVTCTQKYGFDRR